MDNNRDIYDDQDSHDNMYDRYTEAEMAELDALDEADYWNAVFRGQYNMRREI